MIRTFFAALSLLLVAGSCASPPKAPATPQVLSPPPLLLGEFEDDYGNRYTVTPAEFFQRPRARYRVLYWRPSEQYLVARNDSANASDSGLWTRIDWLPLGEVPPYTWGFCLSAYKAVTAQAADSVRIANRAGRRTGCNGFPFSRMRRAP